MSLPKQHVTFFQYLAAHIADGTTEFKICAQDFGQIAGVKIYIHPLGKDGQSRDFIVRGNETKDVTQWLPEQNGDTI